MLSIDINLELPVFKTEPNAGYIQWLHSSEFIFFPFISIFLIATGATFIIYKYYKCCRNKLRRRHMGKLKIFSSVINTKKVPSV